MNLIFRFLLLKFLSTFHFMMESKQRVFVIYQVHLFQIKCLCKSDIYTKVEKCQFHSELVEYLEYILSPSNITMSNNKVKIIHNWPEPKKVKDIQFFLGFTNFYHQFIFNYSNIAILLTHLIQKDIPWNFNNF